LAARLRESESKNEAEKDIMAVRMKDSDRIQVQCSNVMNGIDRRSYRLKYVVAPGI
jgi:hypothetical protein